MSTSTTLDLDFTNYEGRIIDNEHKFPELVFESKNGKKRIFQICVAILNKKNEKQLISKSYLTGTLLPEGCYAITYSISGQKEGKHTKQKPTTFNKITNPGKKNQRNEYQTALISARKKYLNKLKKTGSDDNIYPIFPMLISKTDHTIPYEIKNEDGTVKDNIVFIQPKLDGDRALSYVYDMSDLDDESEDETKETKNDTRDNVIMYSRQKNPWHNTYNIRPELKLVFNELPNLIIDGELYKHGKVLTEISGEAKKIKENKNSWLEYHIYDCVDLDQPELTFMERMQFLKQIKQILLKNKCKYVKIVGTYQVKNHTETTERYQQFLKAGYEGAILRNGSGLYSISKVNNAELRTKELVKLKDRDSDEFKIVGFKDGNGTNKGCIIWVCQTEDGKRFDVAPNGPLSDREKVYDDCIKNFKKKYEGKPYTVEYFGLSKKDGIPQQPRGIIIRDYE